MEKRLAEISELLVDTSFLLPFVGIRVTDANLNLEGKILHYPSLMLTELFAVIMKEAKKRRLASIPREALDGFLYVGYEVNLIQPVEQDLIMTYEVIRNGWNDVFDAILYATHVRTSLPLVTVDERFVNFLSSNGFNVNGILLVS
ncbi:PIN domain-containing protein [Metallosphaera javensis (ex Sakai et al. 2022)]|uniref:PIN domain-containing protein n=1 Tax=Metallosphaera javensis (ex Sakai et al. 2022) TaxID=2775498 RepID=UPI0025850454|nr:MAG: PIN domain-containing protein [Metallosphaera javensis (ex Sakai et al. 2022)]